MNGGGKCGDAAADLEWRQCRMHNSSPDDERSPFAISSSPFPGPCSHDNSDLEKQWHGENDKLIILLPLLGCSFLFPLPNPLLLLGTLCCILLDLVHVPFQLAPFVPRKIHWDLIGHLAGTGQRVDGARREGRLLMIDSVSIWLLLTASPD